jgi:pyruvate formate lyase activating enzyme
MNKSKGVVFNIERFTLHDGPGIRTTVFLKGCPMNCLWCCNPESQKIQPELAYFPEKCTVCGHCLTVCPQQAIREQGKGQPITILFERCDGCVKCMPVCYPNALVMMGEEKTAREVADVVVKDKPFYNRSSGGVTLSGGEPLFQSEFSAEILRLCKDQDIHTAMQTCGLANSEAINNVLPSLDLTIFDIKHINDEIHRQLTGRSNQDILTNLRYINGQGKQIILQVPLIPGLNDSEDNLSSILLLAKELTNVVGVSLLTYHTLGISKYERLGRKYAAQNLTMPTGDYLQKRMSWAEQFNVPLIQFNG